MAREIKFRGQCVLTGEWLHGGLIQLENVTRICWTNEYNTFCSAVIDKNTLTQYTGLKDKNGREIYEGDIVQYNDFNSLRTGGHAEDKIIVGQVTFDCGMWLVEEANGHHDLYEGLVNDEEFEIIGNRFENPELLEVRHGKGES